MGNARPIVHELLVPFHPRVYLIFFFLSLFAGAVWMMFFLLCMKLNGKHGACRGGDDVEQCSSNTMQFTFLDVALCRAQRGPPLFGLMGPGFSSFVKSIIYKTLLSFFLYFFLERSGCSVGGGK